MEKGITSRKLKKLLPNFIIEISKDFTILENTYSDFNLGTLPDNTTYVKMTGVLQKGNLVFGISSTTEPYTGDLIIFPTDNKAIENIQLVKKAVKETTQILNIFSKEYISELEEVYIKEVVQTYGKNKNGLSIVYNVLYTDCQSADYTTIFLPFEKDRQIPVGNILHEHLQVLAGRVIPNF